MIEALTQNFDPTHLKNAWKKYLNRHSYRLRKIRFAKYTTKRELEQKFSDLIEKRSFLELFKLAHSVTNSSIWIGHSYYKLLTKWVDFKRAMHDLEFSEAEDKTLALIESKNTHFIRKNCTPEQIFSVVFKEIEYSYYNPDFRPRVKAKPMPNITLVLVSGVLNEIFSTPAFERSARYLEEKIGLKFFSPEVRGTKGVQTNVKLLERQLYDYIELNPKEKLWILGFSKGGVDTLHFLKHNHDFASKYILGLSTLASPILGSEHTEHKLIRALSLFHDFFETRNIKDKDILFKEIYESLSANFQTRWFNQNIKNLPKLNFYTSLAFESHWYNSHAWMILTKAFFQSKKPNDGIVDTDHAQFPENFKGINLGVYPGHHLIGQRSSHFPQEALIESLVITLQKLGLFESAL